MSALLTDLCSSVPAQRVGWALVHFLWQGAAVALLLAATLHLLNRRSARTRYAAACCALATMALLPVVTGIAITPEAPPVAAAKASAPAAPPAALACDPAAAESSRAYPGAPSESSFVEPAATKEAAAARATALEPKRSASPARATWSGRVEEAVGSCLPWGIVAWGIGVIALSIWHLSGWLLLQRIRRLGTRPAGSELVETLAHLRRRLAISLPVRLLESAMVKVPTVIGWLRPVVLLPVGVLCGLTPSQVEAILAHELAHVRRYDCLVRMIQAAVETLLFYHPAVWWVSGRVRQESEHCCDELAVGICGDRIGYAQALALVAGAGRQDLRLASAAGGGELLPRIRRILGVSERPGGHRARSFAGVAASLVVLAAIIGCAIGQQSRPPAKSAPAGGAGAPAAAATEDSSSSSANLHPLPSGAEVRTQKAFDASSLAWLRRSTVEAYPKVGRKSDKWDSAAARFLELSLRPPEATAATTVPAGLLEAGKAVIDAGCDDPLVLHYYGSALIKSGSAAQGQAFLRRALDGFPKTSYAPTCTFLSALGLRGSLGGSAPKEEQDRLEDLLLSTAARMASGGTYSADEQRILYVTLAPWLHVGKVVAPDSRCQRFCGQIADRKDVDPWLRNYLLGDLEAMLAWEARGGGWADTVTEGQWKGFREHLGKARRHLTDAWKANPRFPEAPERMIMVATGGDDSSPGDSARAWFDRAVAAQFDYIDAYSQLRRALLPRWGGSHRQMLDLGLECAATKRFDTDVPWELYRTIADIGEDMGDRSVAFRRGEVYAPLQEMIDGYLRDPHSPSPRINNLSHKAAIAWCAGKWKDARPALDEAGSGILDRAFTQIGCSTPDLAISEVYARTGKAAEDLEKADDLVRRDLGKEAADLLSTSIQKVAKGEPRAIPYLRQRSWTLKQLAALAKGEWADITPGKDLAGWHVVAGDWSVKDDGAVEAKPLKKGLSLVCDLPDLNRVELNCKIEFVRVPGRLTQAGLLLNGRVPQYSYSVLLFPQESKAVVSPQKHFTAQTTTLEGPDITMKETNELHVEIWDGKLTGSVNGKPVCDGFAIENAYNFGPHRIALGGSYWYEGPIIRFREVKVRTLKDRPATTAPSSPVKRAAPPLPELF
jgi:beta-lactamase regulating signal transducer with metallopeptidase domain